MRKLWLVAKHEYLKRVRKRAFLLAVLGLPLLIVAIGVVAALVAIRGGDSRPVGYVDHAGFLNPEVLSALQDARESFPEYISFADEATAEASLEAGDIQSFYVLPEDYISSKELRSVYAENDPSEFTSEGFGDYIEASLIVQQPPAVRERLSAGFDLTVRSSDGRRELSEGNILDIVLPFIIAFLMLFAIASIGGYMLEAVIQEKEDRTMEILTTSVSPFQLMGGKALGLMCVSLTQILVWAIALAIGIVVGARYIEALQNISIPWEMLIVAILYFIPTFALIAGMMISIGATVTEMQQGQQISGMLNMLFMLPVFFGALIVTNQGSPLLVALTLFPTTAFLTILLRWSTSVIPLWQLVVSWTVLVGSAGGTVWLAGRILRLGMLRYGQRLRLKGIMEGLRSQFAASEKEVAPRA
ncbi:MAG: ABC transporter permease [Anaerolineae bacterium]|nr:ABC transporter permease [Anaerolineae bacterium]